MNESNANQTSANPNATVYTKHIHFIKQIFVTTNKKKKQNISFNAFTNK